MNCYSSSLMFFSPICWSKIIALVLVLTIITFTITPQVWSQDASSANSTEGGSASSAGMQAAAAVSSILYFPLKAVFAIGGGLVGGLAYVFSGGNENAAKSIWTTSMYGTYIITPDHLRGDKPIRFLGVADMETPTMETPTPAPASAPATEPVR